MQYRDDPITGREPWRRQAGFTLIELLVVVLVIGVLAAIALPTFLSQSHKAEDADAKSNARNVGSAVEVCHQGSDDYTKCDTAAKLVADGSQLSVAFGSAAGEVDVSATAADKYTIVAHSRSGGDFTISHNLPASWIRTCSNPGKGGCPAGGLW